MRLRAGQATDLEAVERIVRLAYSPYVARIGRRPPPMDHDYRSRIRAGAVTVAEDTELLGLIVQAPRADHLFIENVAVAPAAQHRGIGRLLLSCAEQSARDRGLSETRLYTNILMVENLALYRRLGYVEVDRVAAGGLGRVEMVKRLDAASS